jgi:hypothetical protein
MGHTEPTGSATTDLANPKINYTTNTDYKSDVWFNIVC